MVFYFFGCGNSRFIAESIVQAINGTLVFIPEVERENRFEYTFAEGERAGFVFHRDTYCLLPVAYCLKFVYLPPSRL